MSRRTQAMHAHALPPESEFSVGAMLRCDCGQDFWLSGFERPYSWWPVSRRTARKAKRRYWQ